MPVKNSVLISLFAVLTSIGALLVIPLPFSPVPITLQTLFCVMSGIILGKKLGLMSQLLYISLGLAGLPVFAKGGSGIAPVLGPTGGYILSFPFAALLSGWLSERGYVLPGIIISYFLIFTAGLLQLKFVLQLDWLKALSLGFLPFIPGMLIKIVLSYSVYKALLKNRIIPLGVKR